MYSNRGTNASYQAIDKNYDTMTAVTAVTRMTVMTGHDPEAMTAMTACDSYA